jgi:hypothetical protein
VVQQSPCQWHIARGPLPEALISRSISNLAIVLRLNRPGFSSIEPTKRLSCRAKGKSKASKLEVQKHLVCTKQWIHAQFLVQAENFSSKAGMRAGVVFALLPGLADRAMGGEQRELHSTTGATNLSGIVNSVLCCSEKGRFGIHASKYTGSHLDPMHKKLCVRAQFFVRFIALLLPKPIFRI